MIVIDASHRRWRGGSLPGAGVYRETEWQKGYQLDGSPPKDTIAVRDRPDQPG
jgi:hypothetical protein